MYIKQIIIQGFKSYKEQTVIEPFSPKHNVIVGRNGSGKSNFFAAIRFVLSDAYTQMGKEERQALLHEGTGAAVMSAFVEIIFDNSDERFPTGKPELILRRTIGVKKDEYSLDRKNATKSDVMNLLESAGFSRSNPYYIVPQGRVTALTNMKDGERLTLLKEVAGTQVYEARRAESLKIMTETNNKRSKIDDLLSYIKDRLAELEEEKEELRDYEEQNKERRCLQYTFDHREQVLLEKQLERIEEQRQGGQGDTDDSRSRFVQGEKDMAEIDSEVNKMKQEMELLKVDKGQLDSERREIRKEKARAELELKSLSENRSSAQQAKVQYDDEVNSIQRAIQEHEKELDQVSPQFAAQKSEETAVKAKLDNAGATRSRLYAKQGRNAQFKSKKERDDWLRKEINDSNPQLTKIRAVRTQTEEEISELEQTILRMETSIAGLREQLEQRGNSSETMQSQLQAKKGEVEKLHEERGELWREEAKLNSVLLNLGKELEQAEREISYRMDANTSRGLAAVRRIKRTHNLEGVYGTLGELMEVSRNFDTAVEETAGNSLFHYVVDNDETASRVLEILQKERSGRITFMPLNRLRPKYSNLPKASDAMPMMEKIQFDPMYESAFRQVFGKTIICPNLSIASQYARSHGVSAVTLDGDKSDKKGALSGGANNRKKSRIEAIRNVTRCRREHEVQKQRFDEVKRAVERKHQEITVAKGELQKLEQTKQRQESNYGPIRHQLFGQTSSLQNRRDELDSRRRALDNIDANIKILADQQSAHEAEMNTEFKKALTQEEETQLENLASIVKELHRRFAGVSSKRSELESRKSTLEIELREHFRPRLDQLNAQAYETAEAGSDTKLNEAQKELKKLDKVLERTSTRQRQLEESIDQVNSGIEELEQRRAEIRQQQEDIAKFIEKQQTRLTRSMQKKSELVKQHTEVTARIRDLGMLPQEAFAKYRKMKPDDIVSQLQKVNEALKKYSHVNKKAFQQYEQFTNQRETLTKRREELDSSQESIEDLIAVLDQRKDEAIERTFKQVSREFATVFGTLVPAGRGRLIIQRKTDRQQAEEEDSDEEQKESVENYTGVGISVSFNSKHDEQQRIQQLSGGQKSLCALALVFAIQRCDPAPFYLFDEIDANLDAQYRTAVAKMLQAVSQASENDGQFICTTFRPEMLLVAEKCYGVRYVGKSSTVAAVSREDAMEFVQGEKQ